MKFYTLLVLIMCFFHIFVNEIEFIFMKRKLLEQLVEWKNCKKLAEQFDLTGGEIDNIIRKIEMYEIMNMEEVNFNKIVEFCKDEKWQLENERKRVGF